MGIQSHLEHLLNHGCKKHPVSVGTDGQEADNVDSFAKATNIARHLKERVDDALIFHHSIRQAELALKIGCRIYLSESLMAGGLDGQEIIILCLVALPNLKVAVFELHFVVVQIYVLPNVVLKFELIIEG